SSAWVWRCCLRSVIRSFPPDSSKPPLRRFRPEGAVMNINLTLLMQAVAFGVFIWFTARFIWPPLMRAIENRQKQIADGLAAGEEGRHSLANAEKRVAEMLTDAKTHGSEIVAQRQKTKS